MSVLHRRACLVCTRRSLPYVNNFLKFTDIDRDAWYISYISSVCTGEVMNGSSETTFEPNSSLTRGMLVTILFRANYSPFLRYGFDISEDLNKKDMYGYESSGFSDVPADTWYTAAVNWASALGIVNGYRDGSFRPDAPVTREEAITVFARYYKLNAEYLPTVNDGSVRYVPHADDAEISSWARDAFELCAAVGAVYVRPAEFDESGALTDTTSYYFEPARSITRAEGAKLLVETLLTLKDHQEGTKELPKSLYIPYTK